MERIRSAGLSLVEGEQKFFVRGVSYGPFRPVPTGEPFPAKDVVERDLALLHELGANTLRVYHVPPAWLRELCGAFDMRLLVGVPWAQHIRFLDSAATRAEIRAALRRAAEELAEDSNLLGILIGNEIPAQVVRWYGPQRVERFLAELADTARDACPETLVSYASFPTTEYLSLDFADFLSFNVYLHDDTALRHYVARLQNLAGARPLVISEFGADSMRQGEEEQARILGTTAETISELGCAGAIAFSYTDEWFTGGFDVEDWAFGLVTRNRERKPAFEALRSVYRSELPPPPADPPRVSVVICAYNAERTMEECLDSLRRLHYPDFEVIVVDDGSTDATNEIARRYPEFRLITQKNEGLSVARNEGILAATGDVVAFTDSDCAADPDWLTFLVHRLESGEFAAVGGPNLPPPEEDWVPEAVARSPGGPTHVLLTDWEAEHVPGCNMAFWRDRLLEVGMFDPIYRAAGDDVDVCWRLQNAGYQIGFAASALVWHRRRNTIGAYLKQQKGYGHAESLLYFKYPHRFNGLGQSRWLGRIYTDLGGGVLATRPAIYGGPFGSGLFQTLYEPPSTLLRHLPLTLEWTALALGLAAAWGLTWAAGATFPMLLLAALAMLTISVAECVYIAFQADVDGLPRLRARALIALLTYAGPMVRAIERHRRRAHGLSRAESPPDTHADRSWNFDLRRLEGVLSFWNQTGIEKEQCISSLVDFLERRQYLVVLDDGWQTWDAVVHSGVWTRCEVKILVQNHGESKRQVDVALGLRPAGLSRLAFGAFALAAALAAVGGAWPAAGFFCGAALAFAGFCAVRMNRLGRSLRDAVRSAFQALPLVGLSSREARGE